ncbi:MAG: copper chaperone PCu(A)C [Spirochaetia bacterium]|nr:copper chaperone PCu(A)C [Spirochaetia bacterium]
MKKILTMIVFIAPLFLYSQQKEDITIQDPLIRLVPASSPNTAGFMKISNSTSKEIRLIKAESDFSQTVELHNVVFENAKMMMRPVESIVIPANSTVELRPGSLHIMFIGIKNPLTLSDTKKVTLKFDNNKSIEIDIPVKEITNQMKK